MSIKSKAIAGAVVLTVVTGLVMLAVPAARAATPQCGQRCIEVFSPVFGTQTNPNF